MTRAASNTDHRMRLFLPVAFMSSLAIGLYNLGILFDLRTRFDLSPSSAGWLSAVWAFSYLAGCFLLKSVSFKLLPRVSMTIACSCSAFFIGLYWLFPSIPMAFVSMALYGFSTSLLWPPLMGWLTSGLEGEALAKTNSTYSVSWSAAGIAAPYCTGLLSERNSWLPVGAAVVLFGFTSIFIYAGRRYAPDPLRADDRIATAKPGEDRSTALRYPAWIGVLVVYALAAVFGNIFPLYARNDLDLSESRIGLLLLIRAAASAFGFWLFGRNASWHFKRQLILAPVLGTLAVNLLFLVVRGPVMFAILLAFIGLFQAWAYTNSMFYGASGALNREKRMNTHESLLTVGQIIGSVGGGMTYQYFSWNTVFVFVGLLLGLGLVWQMQLVRRTAPGR